MKKIKKSHRKMIEPVVLYFDDLEKIIEIFKEASNDIEISTDEYELETIKEIKESDKEILNSLSIMIHEPYVSLELKPNEVWLYISEDEPVSRGVFEKIKQLLSSRRQKLYWLAKINWISGGMFYGAIAGSSVLFLGPGILEKNIYNILLGCSILILGLILSLWSYNLWMKRHSIIYTKRRIESTSFWNRKKDDIVLAIIFAIVGSIITLLITQLFK